MESDTYQTSLKWISEGYYDYNGSHIETLSSPPNPLEFSRMVHISRPVIIKGFNIEANKTRWTNQYLLEKLGPQPVSIAVTPNGLADAVTPAPNGRLYFVEPHYETMSFSKFMPLLSDDIDVHTPSEVHYLQSQNNNLAEAAFQNIQSDVPKVVPWCEGVFDKPPEAVNIWIGDGRSATSIHSDPFENIYTVVRGEKHFTLLPPTDGWCLEGRRFLVHFCSH